MSYMDNAGMVTYNADLATRGLMPPEAGGGIQTVEYFEDFLAKLMLQVLLNGL